MKSTKQTTTKKAKGEKILNSTTWKSVEINGKWKNLPVLIRPEDVIGGYSEEVIK